MIETSSINTIGSIMSMIIVFIAICGLTFVANTSGNRFLLKMDLLIIIENLTYAICVLSKNIWLRVVCISVTVATGLWVHFLFAYRYFRVQV